MTVNVWVALSPCGVDAPSLDVVAKRLDDLAATGTDGALFDWTVGNPLVERLAAGAIVRPIFEPGDALMFDHMMLHRTGKRPDPEWDLIAPSVGPLFGRGLELLG